MKKIMIVDDSLFVLEEMKLCLMNTEYEIAGYVRSGEEALIQYEIIKPDIVTMDIILPGIDGVTAARKILDRWPDACILMVSSLAYDDTIGNAAEMGAKDFIFKPFNKERLIEKLNSI